MQGINAKEHQTLMAAFYKFEQMALIAQDKISNEEDNKTREGIANLRKIHSEFHRLLGELNICVKEYEMQRKAVRSIMHKSIRKMSPEMQKRRRYL